MLMGSYGVTDDFEKRAKFYIEGDASKVAMKLSENARGYTYHPQRDDKSRTWYVVMLQNGSFEAWIK